MYFWIREQFYCRRSICLLRGTPDTSAEHLSWTGYFWGGAIIVVVTFVFYGALFGPSKCRQIKCCRSKYWRSICRSNSVCHRSIYLFVRSNCWQRKCRWSNCRQNKCLRSKYRRSNCRWSNCPRSNCRRMASWSKVIWLMKVWFAPQIHTEGRVSDDELLHSYMESITSHASRSEVIRLMDGAAGTGKTGFLCRLIKRITRVHKEVPKVRFNSSTRPCCFRPALCEQSYREKMTCLQRFWYWQHEYDNKNATSSIRWIELNIFSILDWKVWHFWISL